LKEEYEANSLSVTSAVSMGTGVMIGAGIFALTGQVAELAGPYFPLAFFVAAIVTGFSAYSYIKMSNAFPSAGGIAMYLEKAYGRGTLTGASAILMALSMVINESLVARTFGTYTLQLFDIPASSVLVPTLGVGLIIFAFLVNISGNRSVGLFSLIMAIAKVVGIAVFALASLWIAGGFFPPPDPTGTPDTEIVGFIAALALAILAYKGFTTITNSGSELVDPHKNLGWVIIYAIGICFLIYMLVAMAVYSSLPLSQIVEAKDFALAQAARPLLGNYGLWFTVILAIVATASGLIASIFAVSRMLTMLTDMKLIPHRHFGMPGPIRSHLLVYTVVIAILLTVFFDLSRIAALGAIFYLVMDVAVHWGVFRHLRHEIGARAAVLLTAIFLDVSILGAFIWMRLESDPFIAVIASAGLLIVFVGEWAYLRTQSISDNSPAHKH
jgi:amino acid transporter